MTHTETRIETAIRTGRTLTPGRLPRSGLLALLLALAAPAATADVVVLDAQKDNTLFQSASGSLSSGQGEGLFAGRTGTNNGQRRKRGLIAFDVAGAVPAGSTIDSVTLTLYMRMTVSGNRTVTVHRVTQDWGEGTSVSFGGAGAPATTDDATWLHTFFPDSTWTSVGGDFLATVSASQVVGAPGFYDWSGAQLTADVQDMLDDPAGNFGWLLRGDESTGFTVKMFGSRESFTASERPQLTIDYTPPSGVVSYCTAGTSSSGCQALLSASGTPSASAPSGFVVSAATVEGAKDGLYFFGTSGRQANPWGNGTSYQCVVPPVKRAGLLTGSGTSGLCDGAFAQDLNARWASKPTQNPGAGALVQTQLWYRDPQNTSNQTTSLSDALEFTVGP